MSALGDYPCIRIAENEISFPLILLLKEQCSGTFLSVPGEMSILWAFSCPKVPYLAAPELSSLPQCCKCKLKIFFLTPTIFLALLKSIGEGVRRVCVCLCLTISCWSHPLPAPVSQHLTGLVLQVAFFSQQVFLLQARGQISTAKSSQLRLQSISAPRLLSSVNEIQKDTAG